jgi:hypothetical protein
MNRGILVLLAVFAVTAGFAQNPEPYADIRDYVGLISVADHPDIITFVEKINAETAKDQKEEQQNSKSRSSPEKKPPYERPAGSGFLVRGEDGKIYVMTNCHVISDAWNFSITFEKAGGEKTLYPVILIASDEKKDLALLAFAEDNKPDREGLSFLDRPVREGETAETVAAQNPQANAPAASNTRVAITIAAPQSLDDGEVFGLFKFDMAKNPYPHLVRLEPLLPSNERIRLLSVEYAGGELTVPYHLPPGTALILSQLNREIHRETVVLPVEPLSLDQL